MCCWRTCWLPRHAGGARRVCRFEQVFCACCDGGGSGFGRDTNSLGGSLVGLLLAMCAADAGLVALERGEVVVVGSEADVSVGAHGEERGALDAEEISCDRVEASAVVGQVRTAAEGDRFEQGRLCGELVEGIEDFGQFPVGLSPLDALRASTSLAARACGLTDTGRLDPGLRADVLAVDGNPLDQISDLEHVKLVICNGRIAADPTSIATSSH